MYKYMRFILGLILGLFIMFFFNELKNRCLLGSNAILGKIIRILVRQAARWSTAAKQDKNSMVEILHANYGAAYLFAIKDIASSEQISQATGIDVLKFEKEIISIQDNATKKMVKLCKKFAPKKTYLTSLGGEGFNS